MKKPPDGNLCVSTVFQIIYNPSGIAILGNLRPINHFAKHEIIMLWLSIHNYFNSFLLLSSLSNTLI